jgi:predicted O-methyltransferase YrrM
VAVTVKPRQDLGKDILEAFTKHFIHSQSVHGWMSDAELTALFTMAYTLKNDNPVVVEIGSFQGKSSVCIAGGLLESGRGGTLYCVDPFDLTNQEQYIKSKVNMNVTSLRDKFNENTKDYPNIIVQQGFSVDIARESDIPDDIDMVFIDGNHDYAAVRADVETWVPCLKPGGVLAMHDVDFPGDLNQVAILGGGWCTDPIRVVCDLGLGLAPLGWRNAGRIETLFAAVRTEAPWLRLG